MIYDRDGGICGICLKPVERTAFVIDHIVPVVRGGSDAFDNLQPVHFLCNRRKHITAPGDQLRLNMPFTSDEVRFRERRKLEIIRALQKHGIDAWAELYYKQGRRSLPPGEYLLDALERLYTEHLDCTTRRPPPSEVE
jgi:hypothetical protein